MPTRQEIAEFFRLSLRLEICTVSQVVAWADEVISENGTPPTQILDLSLAIDCDRSTILLLLQEIAGDCNRSIPRRMVLARLWCLVRTNHLTHRKAAEKLYELGLQDGLLPEDDWAMYFPDAFYLADAGYTGDTAAEIVTKLAEFFAEYQIFESTLPASLTLR